MDYHTLWMPQLKANRRIAVYLPPSYASGKRAYSVLYMHDGQNLFNDDEAFSRAWRVGNIVDKMPIYQQSIIVGIDNGGAERINEYAPFKRGKQGGNGANYLKFIVETLKPFIDAHYRTLPSAEHTWLVGSSLGGLISFYGGLMYPSVFGKIGVLSPAFWFNPKILTLDPTSDLSNNYFYVVGSKTESQSMEKTLQDTYWRLKNLGIAEDHFSVVIQDRGTHSEAFWAKEFKKLYLYLIKN